MYTCHVCGKEYTSARSLLRHLRTKCARGTSSRHKCESCPFETTRRDNMLRHIRYKHRGMISDYDTGSDEFVKRVIDDNYNRIRTYSEKNGRHQNRYNFEIVSGTTKELMNFVRAVYEDQVNSFKLNLSFGFILQNTLSNQLVYYYASNNNRVFEKPITIENETDLDTVESSLGSEDILEYCRQQRPNTKFVVRTVTNAYFYVDKMFRFPIGCCGELPGYIKAKKSIISLDKDWYGRAYTDNYCFFRCIAYHSVRNTKKMEEKVEQLVQTYFRETSLQSTKFGGIKMGELKRLERLFNVNINVFRLDENRVAHRLRRSASQFDQTVHLNLFGNHFSYITNLKAYSSKWRCLKCSKLFLYLSHLKRHTNGCSSQTKLVFPGGGYGQPKSIFDKIEDLGITIPGELKYYPFRLSFDFESLMEGIPRTGKDAKEVVTHRLVPASASICSNVPSFLCPKHFQSDDPRILIAQMYQYIASISNQSYKILIDRYQPLIKDLNHLRDKIPHATAVGIDPLYMQDNVKRLETELDRWLKRIPALGFNSGKFDINLVRKYLIPYALENGVKIDSIIKKNNDYLAVSTEHAVFLDIKNYVAAGTSYDKWLKSNDVKIRKGVFPYEWFTSFSKLDETSLPEKTAFWSSLKQRHITDVDYEAAKQLWDSNSCQTMRDYLRAYNNLDVEPFLEAAQKLFDYWVDLGIDPFKSSAISLPGLALSYLTKRMTPHTILPLIPKKHEHLYHLLRQNIVGGLAVVNHRYHEVGVTSLPNGKPTGWIYSFDCNSLYLWALGQPMGTGIYATWLPRTQAMDTMPWKLGQNRTKWDEILRHNMSTYFHRTNSYTVSKKELEWLEWTAKTSGYKIGHRFNGKQMVFKISRTTQYPVDGFAAEQRTVFQFHGCHWHGHGCAKDRNPNSGRERASTEAVTSVLRSLGYKVVEKWECEWDEEKKKPEIYAFIAATFKLGVQRTVCSGETLISKLRDGSLFGIVECDIEVPWWNRELVDKFEEFPPICKNVDITINDIGSHMRKHAEEHGLMKKPRRNLINSFWTRKSMLTTPILRWLLNKGLVITRIYQVIEMVPRSCFADIRDEVTAHRRKADLNADHKSSGESWKTLGNSLYGKTMTNKEKHKNCKLVLDDRVENLVNSSLFCKMEEVGDIAYEVSLDKTKIKIDLPLTVAFFVYNYAKLRMLEYVYDFLKKYLRPGSFQIVCSDTDSIIAAYESREIDKLVLPALAAEYFAWGKKAFLSTDQDSLRTPGLFKVELSATWIVALCSKTYLAENKENGEKKVSSKGLSKTTNSFTQADYKNVLDSKEVGCGVNYGFKINRDELYQYRQERFGLPYLYVKRVVQEDGVSTRALHL